MVTSDDDAVDYSDYNETTVDPGFSFVVGVVVICVILNAMLPCVISLGSKYEKRRKESCVAIDDKANDEEDGASKVVIVDLRKSLNDGGINAGLEVVDARSQANQTNLTNGTPRPGGRNAKVAAQHNSNDNDNDHDHDNGESVSMFSSPSTVLSGAKEILTKVVDTLVIPPYPTAANRSVATSGARSVASSTLTGSILEGGRPKRRRAQYSRKQEAERRQESMENQHRRLAAPPSVKGSVKGSVKESVMGPLNPDEISFTEAVDYYAPGKYTLPKEEEATDIDLVYGEHAWWKPRVLIAAFDMIVGIAEWDIETRKIVKLAIPYSLQAILTGVFEAIEIGIIGHYFGVNEANAIIIVSLFFELTATFNYGFIECLGSLVPHAIGAENEKKAGNLISESAILYLICSLPGIVLWFNITESSVLFFGFDESTAQLGQRYVYIYGITSLVEGFDEIIYQVLDVIEYENYATWMTLVGGIFDTGMLITFAVLGIDDLILFGYFQLGLAVIFLIINVLIMAYTGWLSDYTGGIFSAPFMDLAQTKTIMKTALPLGIAYILTYGEWEVLTIFASVLGPAEVATWGLLGYIWNVLEYISDGVADASEVRCGIHLGANNPEAARLCAYKSIFIGLITSLFATSVLFIVGEDVVRLITPDATLQRLMLEILPLVGLGQIGMTTGIMSWAIIGAQGRYRLATTIQFVASWGATVPLSALFTYAMNLNLQGLVGALAIGYTLAGTANTYVLVRSHWGYLATTIAERNEDDSSSSSSDDDDDASGVSSSVSSGKGSQASASGAHSSPRKLLARAVSGSSSDDGASSIN